MCHGQIINEAIRRARKQHRCDYCGKPIPIGKGYHIQVIARDGLLDTWRTHRVCEAIIKATDPYDFDGCMVGDPRDHAREVAKHMGWRSLLEKARKLIVRKTT